MRTSESWSVIRKAASRIRARTRGGWWGLLAGAFALLGFFTKAAAAFYAAARHIFLERSEEFWERLGTLEREVLFVWGRYDMVIPRSFAPHVRDALPSAKHAELNCGHVPQIERPDETLAVLRRFLSS